MLSRLGGVGALVIGVGWGAGPAMAADCFARLDAGAQAQMQGDLKRARLTFEQALEIAECRDPPHGDLLRFSLGRLLLEMAPQEPGLACEAQTHLAVARDSQDESVAAAAAAALVEAEEPCVSARIADDWGDGRAAAAEGDASGEATSDPLPRAPRPPSVEPESQRPLAASTSAPMEGTVASAASPSEERWVESRLRGGPRIAGGVSGMAVGGFEGGQWIRDAEFTPGACLGIGVALEYALSERWALLAEPGIALTSVVLSADVGGTEASSLLRRTIAESLLGAGWSPGGGDTMIRMGVRGGWVLDAVEASALIGDRSTPLEMASVTLDAMGGGAYAWSVGPTRLQVSVDASLSILRINDPSATGGFYGYRVTTAVGALF